MLDGAFNFREFESTKKTPVGDFFLLVVSYARKRIKVYIGNLAQPRKDERLLYHW